MHAMLINNDEVGINIFGSVVNYWKFVRLDLFLKVVVVFDFETRKIFVT